MRYHIDQLYNISRKKSRNILGLMSGTSLDGLDMALCQITGSGHKTKIDVQHFDSIAYCDEYKHQIASIFAKPDGDLQDICLLNAWVANYHSRLILQFFDKCKLHRSDIDLIASHGQTVFHAPKSQHGNQNFPNSTLQIGDGDHIAVNTGIITLSDFRQKHVAAGGQGAPLVSYGDYLQFSHSTRQRILLNIGGIANFTYIPAGAAFSQVISADCGPGNTLMDAVVKKHFKHKSYDENATLASAGSVHQSLLFALKQHSYFSRSIPKTTGPEVFNLSYFNHALNKSECSLLSIEDQLATLCQTSADTIADCLAKVIDFNAACDVFVSGGGVHNPLLMKMLGDNLLELSNNISLNSSEKIGVDPDAKEAVLFALLANECISGKSETFSNTRNDLPNVSMGKISFPE